jgi:hypothetical protein
MKLLTAALFAAVLNPSLFCQIPAGAPPDSCSLRVRITDASGAAISSGFVLVHNEWAKTTREGPVSEQGEAALQLPPGLYDLFVGSKLFLPVARIVNLRSCKPVDVEVKLQLDPDHPEMQVGGGVSDAPVKQ